MSAKIDLTGKQFGKLTVLHEEGKKRKEIAWLCKCDCGNKIIVNGYALRSGHTQSCGCYMRAQASKANTKHGSYGHRIHTIYYNMKTRCYNPNYYLFEHYGGKGITICNEWLGDKGFQNFYNWAMNNGYSDELSIDRKDNSKGYSPENCRWVTMKVQQNNRTNNHLITVKDETHTIAEWAEVLSINYTTLTHKLKKYSMEDILNGNC